MKKDISFVCPPMPTVLSDAPPIDSLAGILHRIGEVRNAAVRPNRQCPATCATGRGRNVNIVFCEHREGHAGDHKGYRKKWPNEAAPEPSAAAGDASKEGT